MLSESARLYRVRAISDGRDEDPSAIRDQYKRNLQHHAAEVEKTCRELGIDYIPISTGKPLEHVLSGFLQSRLHASRQATRTGDRAVRRGA